MVVIMSFNTCNSRLELAFSSGKKALIVYFPTQDPAISAELLRTFSDNGCDIVELGLKAQNPYLDGTVIRNAMARSSGSGQLSDAQPALRAIRAASRSMAALIFCYASRSLCDSARAGNWVGIDAILCAPEPGTPHQELILKTAREAEVKTAGFVPYRFTEADIDRARKASGYVMLQYADGKTGLREGFDRHAEHRLARLRAAGVKQPIVFGIGLASGDQCRHAIDSGADGVVVGTQAVLKCLDGRARIAAYLSELRTVLGH